MIDLCYRFSSMFISMYMDYAFSRLIFGARLITNETDLNVQGKVEFGSRGPARGPRPLGWSGRNRLFFIHVTTVACIMSSRMLGYCHG